MSDRKETPDILGSVLGQPAAPQRVPDIMPDPERKKAPARRTRKKAATTSAPRAKAAAKTSPKKTPARKAAAAATSVTAWEYQDVMFYDYGGYVLRYIGGKELPDWKRRRARLSDYIDRMGSKGWEMVGLIAPKRHHILAVFKRPKKS